jgi:hypothetical protein
LIQVYYNNIEKRRTDSFIFKEIKMKTTMDYRREILEVVEERKNREKVIHRKNILTIKYIGYSILLIGFGFLIIILIN